MASISLPPQPQTTSSFSHYLDSAPHPAPGHSRRNLTMSSPLPNPPFVFPARDPSAAPQTPERKSRSAAPLPAFSFNPGATHSSQPSMPTLPVNRPGGHRRRCSELIGNDHLVASGAVEANKEETPDPAPAPAPVPAPSSLPTPGPGFSAGGPGRRRHAHRRSAAISSVDLSAIRNTLDLKPPGSSPHTPTDTTQDQHRVDGIRRPISHSAISLGRPTPPASPRITINGESLHPPRPESPVSPLSAEHTLSDAPSKDENTAFTRPETTARNSNVTGDPTLSSQQVEEKPKPRPRTADASLMLSSSANGGSNEMSRSKRPLSATGHSRFRKSLSSGVLDAALRRHNMGDHPWADPRHSSSDDADSDASADEHGASGSGSKKRVKTKKRQKKVRSWAGSILTRGKGKRHQSKKEPSEAKSEEVRAPVLTRTNSDLGSGLDVEFDDDNIVVIRTPTNPNAPRSQQPTDDDQPTLENSWKPRSFYEQDTQQNDTLSPIIDLDAALGPFNTPDMGSRKVAESGFSAASRRMYSGGRRGEFVGPEMRYHRRAESAPALPPFDRSFLASSRLSSNFAMEHPDVFYEEEEDAFLAATSESEKDCGGQVSTTAVSAPTEEPDKESERSKESSQTLRCQRSVENNEMQNTQTGLGIGEPPKSPTPSDVQPRTEESPQTDRQDVTKQLRNASNPFSNYPRGPLDTAKQQDWHQRIPKLPIPPSPDISPRFTPADQRPATSPLELTPNIPQFSLHGGSSISNSSFPSPDFTVSSDAPRSVTTSSTDRNFSNPCYNQSMDFPHASVEDVPSLTSSASTMTNTLNRFSANFFQRPRLSTDRSASFSAAVHRRSSQPNSSKRSSLASLSKLVAGPGSEKSKLSYEEKPPSDDPEKARKKGRRISRLMHFWRTKDKDRLNDDVVREENPS
ncbi:cell wall proline rich protein [Aspergillus terreus]|uniref:Cell wall proline rich protein n=1 Tax=Aspergillus terreus TaxID=33178 RepID=A0A5M3YTF1_ASPTE|nr:hypothetical protein ATETN484_0003048400 [Aspergillus terreus]GFF14473.1 cell wall proline rich protein [Aspergillus terreus]